MCLFVLGKDGGDTRRHSSVSDVPLDSNVLRKVASLTLDKATLEQRVSKPKFVPEKLDFQLYEKFEGMSVCAQYSPGARCATPSPPPPK